MTLVETVEKQVVKRVLQLPERVQRAIAGKPVVLDGQTLALDVQVQLRLKELTRQAGSETKPMAEGREILRHDTRITGGDQPIGSVRELVAGEGDSGRPARLYVPTGAPTTGPLLVFFHGGGFMHGDLDTHDAPCRFLAEQSGVRVLAVDYRLGPEHRFPAAYDDALTAYAWAVEHAGDLGADPDRIGVGGDSAGGTLSAGVAIEAARRGWPCRVQLLIYPATDGRSTTKSADLFAEGFYLTRAYMELASASYARSDADFDDPRYSPARADVPDGLARAIVVTAGFDPLRDEGEAYAARLADAGVQVDLTREPDQVHGFFNITGVGRTSVAANRRIAAALRAAMV